MLQGEVPDKYASWYCMHPTCHTATTKSRGIGPETVTRLVLHMSVVFAKLYDRILNVALSQRKCL
jgi:hypothetical protein